MKRIIGPPPEGCSIEGVRGAETCGTWVYVIYDEPMPPGAGIGLCMTKPFANDQPNPAKITPSRYVKRYVRKWIAKFLPRERVAEEDRAILDRLIQLQTPKPDDETSITPSVEVPPYSEGCIHWDISAGTDIRCLWAVPARKVKKRLSWFEEFVVKALRILASGIIGRKHPRTIKLADALLEAWERDVSKRAEVKEILKVGDLKFYGDIWVLHLSLARAEPMYPPPMRNITQPIKVQIVNAVTKQPVFGEVTIKRLKATTTPEPPKFPLYEQFSVDVPEGDKEIHLGKGWRWELEAFAMGRTAKKEIPVPLEPPSVTIEVPAPAPPPPGKP